MTIPAGACALARLLPEGVAYASLPVESQPDPLEAPERAAVAGAVASRQREFAGGRTCARRALLRLGHAAQPIPVGACRAPVWPHGVVGSITHCSSFAAAAVARAAD